ncbi:MAG: MBOAT family protein [Bacteroidia bacterium]
MVFSSIIFLLYFLPIVLAVNYFLPSKFRNYWLLVASLFFYAWGAPKFLFVLLGSIMVNFFLVKKLDQTSNTNSRKWLLFSSVAVNIGLLAYFKYFNFFVHNIGLLFESMGFGAVSWAHIALPIGISFFTFQSLTYSIDVYRKLHKPLSKWSDYTLYIMLFPQMIAGPIVRFGSIADQVLSRKTTTDGFNQGLIRFVFGLSKKVLIANTLAQYSSESLTLNGTALNATIAWIGILAYAMQIYFDFSGYSDMAIGIGRMLGFNFPENFNNPYNSKSITEFWRRWHITLGTWMRDYLYIPLGGNQVNSNFRLYFNLLFVFLISGFWHGANWNFIIWGAYHGLFLIVERLFLGKYLKKLPSLISIAYAFFVVIIGWIFFSVDRFDLAIEYIKVLFSNSFSFAEVLIDRKFIAVLLLALCLSFIALSKLGVVIQNHIYGYNKAKNTFWVKTLSVFLFLLCTISLVGSGFNPFIYFRF